MDFFESSNTNFDQEKIKSKKLMKIIIIALILVFLLSMGVLGAIFYLKNKELKFYMDGSKTSFQDDLFIFENGKVYVSIKDIAGKIGYSINNGEYKHPYSEDTSKCYLDNGYETVSYTQDSDSIYKVLIENQKNEELEYEYYTIDEPVKLINNKLYVSSEGLEKGCNISFSYTENNNTIKLYTLSYLTEFYSGKITEAAANERNASYTNKKAILYGLMIVKDANGRYGVNSLKNETIIGEKYKSIKFKESSQEFIVETTDGKFGIITDEGATKIEPEYDSIKTMDKERGLYVVSNNKKYGVINNNGKRVIFSEYDQIGIDQTQFPGDDIENPYLLYNKYVPVKKDGKWGILDLNGNTVIPIEFDSLGCTQNTSNDSLAQNLLIVPEYEAIVVCKDKMYGLYNTSGKELIQALVTDMYTITSGGEKKYYLTYQGMKIDILDYLLNVGKIEPVNKTSNSNNTTNNTNNNYNSNNSSNSSNNNINANTSVNSNSSNNEGVANSGTNAERR